jgi:transposase
MQPYDWRASWATRQSCRPIRISLSPREYDRVAYRHRNEIERLFRRLKGYRRIFCRYDKLDALFMGFILLALMAEALRFSVKRS